MWSNLWARSHWGRKNASRGNAILHPSRHRVWVGRRVFEPNFLGASRQNGDFPSACQRALGPSNIRHDLASSVWQVDSDLVLVRLLSDVRSAAKLRYSKTITSQLLPHLIQTQNGAWARLRLYKSLRIKTIAKWKVLWQIKAPRIAWSSAGSRHKVLSSWLILVFVWANWRKRL
jgi:hypothetical protein